MFWCKICSNLSRNDFTIILGKNMVLIDYIGIFFTCGNMFDHILFVYMYKKKLKATDILAVQMLKFVGSFHNL